MVVFPVQFDDHRCRPFEWDLLDTGEDKLEEVGLVFESEKVIGSESFLVDENEEVFRSCKKWKTGVHQTAQKSRFQSLQVIVVVLCFIPRKSANLSLIKQVLPFL